jgi:hypothetical protein
LELIRNHTQSKDKILKESGELDSNYLIEYINNFMQSRKVAELLVGNKLQSKDIVQIINNYAKHLQLPNDWRHYEPASINESLKKISIGTQAEEKMYYPEELPCSLKAKKKEEVCLEASEDD